MLRCFGSTGSSTAHNSSDTRNPAVTLFTAARSGFFLVDLIGRSIAKSSYPDRLLAERANLVVTSDELFTQLWPGIYVTKTVLRVCINELRHALDDNAATPHFIETVGRQGYRFLASVTTTASSSASARVDVPLPKAERAPSPQAPTHFVGRGQELERLQAAVARARQGKRQTVFASGEPGIGKTALYHFLAQLRIRSGSWLMGNVSSAMGRAKPIYPCSKP